MQEPEHVLESGTKVRTHETLDDTKGMTIVEKHLNARAPNKEGVIVGIVGGHGGDVYWVRHPDTVHVAAYGFWEFELADEKTK